MASEQTTSLPPLILNPRPFEDFRPVAESITAAPPSWLLAFLARWSMGMNLTITDFDGQPSRAEMVAKLKAVATAAGVLKDALATGPVVEFLNAGGEGPLAFTGNFPNILSDIHGRAERAATLPILVDKKGRPKRGRGRALVEEASPPKVCLVVIVAEAWKHFHKSYPRPRNVGAAHAADLYWQLSGGERKGWGDKPVNSWRYYLKKTQTNVAEPLRSELRSWLAMYEQAAMLTDGRRP